MEGRDLFPVDTFPHVWLNVYDKLDPKDKLAFAGASSVWHHLVEPKRTESLISEVARYLIDIRPSHPVYLRGPLQARELCQSWKEGVDQENQTHGSNTSLYFEISADEGPHRWHPFPRSWLYGNCFYFAVDAQEFMQEMRTHLGNPFPGRSIALDCHFDFSYEHEDFNEEWRDYWRSIILLLENFGSHLHFASISFDKYDELELGNLEGQAYLRECLLRLPNLKKVVMFGECGSPFVEDEIRDFYRVNPLPRLEHLEAVEVTHTSLATVDEVLSRCCVPANIKRLSVCRHGQEHPEHLRQFDAAYGFKNLEVLFAPILFHHLETLASFERRPPLREVYLSFEDAPHLEDVFRLLEVFGETLIQFRSSSRMRLRNDVENAEPFSCNLPHLKKLVFAEYWGPAELLFQFKSLTHVEIWRMRDTNLGFPGFKERLNDLSIWKLMPCLQWLSLGNPATVYEREIFKVLEQPRQDWMERGVSLGLDGGDDFFAY